MVVAPDFDGDHAAAMHHITLNQPESSNAEAVAADPHFLTSMAPRRPRPYLAAPSSSSHAYMRRTPGISAPSPVICGKSLACAVRSTRFAASSGETPSFLSLVT